MNKKYNKISRNKGLTYIEVIVVLSIFSILTSVTLFRYKDFEAKIDIRNLSNDIAIKLVQAQKYSVGGIFPPQTVSATWKPTYGIYFDVSNATNNRSFVYFTDLNQDSLYSSSFTCSPPLGISECIEKMNITKSNYVSRIEVFYTDATPPTLIPTNLALTFVRPNSVPTIRSSTLLGPNISHAVITVSSPSGIVADIKVYNSGRIQIN